MDYSICMIILNMQMADSIICIMFVCQARKPVDTHSKGIFRRFSLATVPAKSKFRRLSLCNEEENRRISEREILKRELEKFKQKVSKPTTACWHTTHTTIYTHFTFYADIHSLLRTRLWHHNSSLTGWPSRARMQWLNVRRMSSSDFDKS